MPMADKPSIALPPRSAVESFFSGAGFSPGPMTLVNNLFSDGNSFSQLLAGAMNSPVAAAAEKESELGFRQNRPVSLVVAPPQGVADTPELSPFGFLSPSFFSSLQLLAGAMNSPVAAAAGKESKLGFRQNRPVSLVAPPPQGLALPQELSPFGFLSPSFFSPLQSPFGMSHQQALAQVTAQAAFSQSYMQMQPPKQQPYVDLLPHHEPITTSQHVDTVSIMSEPESSAIESPEVTQSERKIVPLSIADKPANDGYNWRKYGQKQVKASEYPRSYYKCTYQNCHVTKKVERNLEGKITEIIYKNQHNHDLPEPSKRTKNSIDTRPNVVSRASPELGLRHEIEVSRSIEVSCLAPGRDQGLPQLTSVPLMNTSNGLEMIEVEPRQNENEDEPYPKRRNIEVEQSDKSSLHKTVTESKIVLQTRSEVDLLDDGYKWRKYGQKVVKGNPHPRSYYKCTFTGCNVRKHVERSSADPKAVITTYEGKHIHDVPAPRKSNNSVSELKQPQKVMAKKHTSNQEMDFNHDQRHLLLQLKEEYTKA